MSCQQAIVTVFLIFDRGFHDPFINFLGEKKKQTLKDEPKDERRPSKKTL